MVFLGAAAGQLGDACQLRTLPATGYEAAPLCKESDEQSCGGQNNDEQEA